MSIRKEKLLSSFGIQPDGTQACPFRLGGQVQSIQISLSSKKKQIQRFAEHGNISHYLP